MISFGCSRWVSLDLFPPSKKKLLGQAKLIFSFCDILAPGFQHVWYESIVCTVPANIPTTSPRSWICPVGQGIHNPFPQSRICKRFGHWIKFSAEKKAKPDKGSPPSGRRCSLLSLTRPSCTCILPMQLQCILSNVSKTVLLTRSSVVVTLRTVRASTTKCRSGTRQAMLLSSSASWPWYWDSDGSWGLSWQSWFPWGWCGFGLVALARFSRSNLPRNVSNSDSQGEEPPPWTNQINDSITKTFHNR